MKFFSSCLPSHFLFFRCEAAVTNTYGGKVLVRSETGREGPGWFRLGLVLVIVTVLWPRGFVKPYKERRPRPNRNLRARVHGQIDRRFARQSNQSRWTFLASVWLLDPVSSPSVQMSNVRCQKGRQDEEEADARTHARTCSRGVSNSPPPPSSGGPRCSLAGGRGGVGSVGGLRRWIATTSRWISCHLAACPCAEDKTGGDTIKTTKSKRAQRRLAWFV
ncbi:hypothetical protein LX32DRAFT_642684 [Colletotrichum zoysiae]|uniref:Uncharacterized protein n=1 Tax=Colletotrichum zoysiae TaxID=1216348 RepID=A0AAD9HCN3_9PEZI|nr:hypothetical protein LX32DRAFT_642684 [Colletotrichum zoysiae]